MKGKLIRTGLAVAALAFSPLRAAAQIPWDSPWLLPPNAEDGFGLFLIDVAGGDLGVMGMFRSPSYNFGIRAGIAEARGDDLGVFGGLDFNGDLTRSTTEFPLDIDWLVGIGVGIVNGALISAPLGLTLGHEFQGDGIGFVPFLSPRVVLDACLDCDDRNDDNDLNLDFAADIGLDLKVTRSFLIRFGATLGDREGVGIGIFF
jgi:hypothetical protein